MMKFAMAVAVASMFLLPGQASAQSTVAAPAVTDVSSQAVVVKKKTVVRRPAVKRTVVVRPGVRTVVRRPAKVCRTVKSTRVVNGRRVTTTSRRCS